MADPVRRALATIARGPLADTAVGLVDRAAPRRTGVVTMLTYHRVDHPTARPDLMPRLLSATPDGFADQMALVARHYDPVSLADVLGAVGRPGRLPRRAVMVTFDDGYRDFATHAWPVMRDLAIPATLFVATAFASDPATPFWWDRLWTAIATAGRGASVATPAGALPAGPDAAMTTIGRLRDWLKTLEHDDAMAEVDRIVATLADGAAAAEPAVLGWDDLRGLAADGVTLAPHTRHHPLLDRVPLERAVAEITGSVADLEREVGDVAPVPPVLAYPSGAHGGAAPEAARRAGMVLAVTTVRGGNDLRRADPLRLRRINVGGRTSTALLRAQLVWAATVDVARRRG